jgi:hypothetical protein
MGKGAKAKKSPTINKGLVKVIKNFSASTFKLSSDEKARFEQLHFSEEQAKKVDYKLGGPIDFFK